MTLIIAQKDAVEEAARKMAAANVEAAPETEAVYLFPDEKEIRFLDEKEIRFIETDPTTLPSTKIVPYYFGAAPQIGVLYRSSVALIRPDEAFSLAPPPGWGTWKDAVQLWP